MVSFSFLAGVICALAALVLLLPWLRTIPAFASLPALPWQAGIAALVVMVAALALHQSSMPAKNLVESDAPAASTSSSTPTGASADESWSDVAAAAGQGLGVPGTASPKSGSGAQSMDAAIAALQSRLARNGGSDDDWELLAKSYDFEGHPDAAAQARAHKIPAALTRANGALNSAGTDHLADVKSTVSGEVTLAPALSAKASPGSTLFILAKAADAPGAPVAVIRSSVGTWPQKFTLDDTQAMLPARTLSSVGRVTIEARISQTGQALAARGDLQGISAPIDPRDHGLVRIEINRVVP